MQKVCFINQNSVNLCEKQQKVSEFYCHLFLLETAVKCSYWYVFRVSLKSAPSYLNAMRPGSINHSAAVKIEMLKKHVSSSKLCHNTIHCVLSSYIC